MVGDNKAKKVRKTLGLGTTVHGDKLRFSPRSCSPWLRFVVPSLLSHKSLCGFGFLYTKLHFPID